jgi:GNAT superfamily N-acetyltransferase
MSQAAPAVVDIATVTPSALAAMHLHYLVSPFRGRSGHKLLELYYETFTRTPDTFGFVALVDNQIAGYACVMRDTRAVQAAVLRRAPFRLAWWALAQVLRHPRLVLDPLVRFGGERRGRIGWQRPDEMKGWWSYRPLVVAEPYRKHGIAGLLMQAVFAEAEARRIPGLIGTSERGNAQSRVNLVRNGYREVWKDDEFCVFVKPVGAD